MKKTDDLASTGYDYLSDLTEEEKRSGYSCAVAKMNSGDIASIEAAVDLFHSLDDWRDSEQKIVECFVLIEQIRAEEDRVRIEQELVVTKKKRKAKNIVFSIISSILCVAILILAMPHMMYQPLRNAINEDHLTAEFVNKRYGNLQNNKRALEIIADSLNTCYRQNDLKKALEIISVVAESGCAFTYGYFDSTGNIYTEYDAHITASDIFLDWLFDAAKAEGQEILLEGSQASGDHTYMVYGYKLTILISSYTQSPCGAYLYVPSVGWYKIERSPEDSAAVIFREREKDN